MGNKYIPVGGRANLVTGTRNVKRAKIESLVLGKDESCRYHPVRIDVRDPLDKRMCSLEMNYSDAFELAMTILEHCLSEGFFATPAVEERIREVAVTIATRNRKDKS